MPLAEIAKNAEETRGRMTEGRSQKPRKAVNRPTTNNQQWSFSPRRPLRALRYFEQARIGLRTINQGDSQSEPETSIRLTKLKRYVRLQFKAVIEPLAKSIVAPKASGFVPGPEDEAGHPRMVDAA